MKRITALILSAAILCVLLCACGKSAFTEDDISIRVNGETIDTHSSVSAILDAFGPDYAFSEAISCVYTGMDKTYQYPDLFLYTYPDGENDRLMEVYCTADVETAKGIGLGASLKDIEAAYGSDYTRAGVTVTYSLPAPDKQTLPATLYFELDGDTVCAIGITSAHRAE